MNEGREIVGGKVGVGKTDEIELSNKIISTAWRARLWEAAYELSATVIAIVPMSR